MDVTDLAPAVLRHLPGRRAPRRGRLHGRAASGRATSAGRILSGLATGAEDEWTSLPLVHREPGRFPPEPFRSIGAAVVQGAIVRRDRAHDRGEVPDPVTDLVAHLPRRMGYELGP